MTMRAEGGWGTTERFEVEDRYIDPSGKQFTPARNPSGFDVGTLDKLE